MTELQAPNSIGTLLFLFMLALPWIVVSIGIFFLLKFLLKKIPQPYAKRTTLLLVILILSVFIVIQTLGFPKTITTPNQLNNITCGWPMPFIEFDSTIGDPNYPTTISCIGWSGSPMDTKKDFLWIPFISNVALTFSLIWICAYLIQRYYNHNKSRTHT